ncbi:MAG: hypothetical protein J6X98_03415 [Bacteroidales bacterium]|nr:hypothetical protein [Bacteroidales bacterium]
MGKFHDEYIGCPFWVQSWGLTGVCPHTAPAYNNKNNTTMAGRAKRNGVDL